MNDCHWCVHLLYFCYYFKGFSPIFGLRSLLPSLELRNKSQMHAVATMDSAMPFLLS